MMNDYLEKKIKKTLEDQMISNLQSDCPDLNPFLHLKMDQLPDLLLNHLLSCHFCMIEYRNAAGIPENENLAGPDWQKLNKIVHLRMIWEWLKAGLDKRIGNIEKMLSMDQAMAEPIALRQGVASGTLEDEERITQRELKEIFDLNLSDVREPFKGVPRVYLSDSELPGVKSLHVHHFNPSLIGHEIYFLSASLVELQVLTEQDSTEGIIDFLKFALGSLSHKKDATSTYGELVEQSFVIRSTVESQANSGVAVFNLNDAQVSILLKPSKMRFVIIG